VVAVRKASSLGGLLAAGVVLVACGVWVVMANPLLEVGACGTSPKTVAWPVWVAFVSAGVAAFGLGNFLGHWRDFSRELDEDERAGHAALSDEDRLMDRRYRRRAVAVQAFLAGSLTLVTVLLAYETWAVWIGAPWWAITDFVRCASNAATPQTFVASTALLFLAGHWLWHPVRGTRR
jgi:hypothetical protein